MDSVQNLPKSASASPPAATAETKPTRAFCYDAKKLPDDFFQFLKSESKLVSRPSAEPRQLRTFNVKEALCTKEMQDQICRPEFFDMFDSYYQHAKKTRQSDHLLRTEAGKEINAPELTKSLVEVIPFFSFASTFGELIFKYLPEDKHPFLASPLPLSSSQNQILSEKSEIQMLFLHKVTNIAKWPRDGIDAFELLEAAKYNDTVPVRLKPLPKLPWETIIRSAMTDMAKATSIDIDFKKTPFFLTFVEPKVANNIAGETLFFEHPSSGNISHGIPSHGLQIIFLGMHAGLDKQTLGKMVQNNLWGPILDLETHRNFPEPVIITDNITDIILTNYDVPLLGNNPESLETFLGRGVMSRFLENGLKQGTPADALLKKFNLPKIAESDEKSLLTHIKHIRAAEYTIAGFTMDLGDFTAQSLKANIKRPLKKLEEIYPFPEDMPNQPYDPDNLSRCERHSWSEFGPDNFNLLKMAEETAKGYMSEQEPYDVYVVDQDLKLKKAETKDDIFKASSYVVYPEGVQPPEACLR